MLLDSTTPERFKERIERYQQECKQLIPVYVEPERGRYFSEVFREEVRGKMEDGRCERVLTTYLDNDDALNVGFVEDVQRRATKLNDETFIYYGSDYQLFTVLAI